jgi:putative spermidine/putrescine transport system substrate-binding protein
VLQRGLGAGVLLGLGPVLAACGASSSSSSKEVASLTFTSWGGTTQDAQRSAWTDGFAKANKVTVTQAGPTDYGRIKAMVDAKHVEWDVVDVEGDFARRAGGEGLLEPIDYSTVAKADLFPEFVSKYGVGDFAYSFVIAYDPKKNGGRHPTNWAEFFDTKAFPGKRSFYKYPYSGIFEAALLADGVPKDKLYPLDFDRAFKKLDTIKDDIVWWETGAQSQQYMTDGSVDYISAWNGRIYDLMQKGVSVAIEWNENLQAADYLVSPKGSPKEAMALIAYATTPEPQARFAELTAYAPVNRKALDLVKADMRKNLSTAPENRSKGIVIDDDFWATGRGEVQSKWDAWLLS